MNKRAFFKRCVLGACVASAALLASVAQAQTQAGQPALKSVGITAIVEHPALNDISKGVEDELKALGCTQGKNIKLTYQSAQGNTATAGQIARKFVGDKTDVIVAITTPSAQAAVAATKTIPVVFSGVTDPVAAKLIKQLGTPSGSNVTGVSDRLPMPPQVDLLLKVKPSAKRVGYVYSPGEVNSVSVLKELKAELAKRGMTVHEVAAPRTVDIPAAIKSLAGKVDVVYTSMDNNVVSAYEAMVRVAQEAKLPLVASDTESVERGAVAALGMDSYHVGRQTGKLVDKILKGAQPGSLPPEAANKLSLSVNPQAAQKQGVTLSNALLKEAATIVK